jgi:hypothetical protein
MRLHFASEMRRLEPAQHLPPGVKVMIRSFRVLAIAFTIVSVSVLTMPVSGSAQTSGMERRGERQDDRQADRGTRQQGREDGRDAKADCKASGESNSDCRQEKRDTKQDARQETRTN